MNNRWYDADPTLSLAVSLIKNSSISLRNKCSNMIIDKAKDMGVELDNSLHERFNMVLRRWYDEDKQLSDALEYIRISPIELQKEIAIDIIGFLEKAEAV